MWKIISRIFFTLLVLMLALRIADRLARRAGPLPTIPQPNGYDTLLAIAREGRAPHGDLIDLDPQTNRLAFRQRLCLRPICTPGSKMTHRS